MKKIYLVLILSFISIITFISLSDMVSATYSVEEIPIFESDIYLNNEAFNSDENFVLGEDYHFSIGLTDTISQLKSMDTLNIDSIPPDEYYDWEIEIIFVMDEADDMYYFERSSISNFPSGTVVEEFDFIYDNISDELYYRSIIKMNQINIPESFSFFINVDQFTNFNLTSGYSLQSLSLKVSIPDSPYLSNTTEAPTTEIPTTDEPTTESPVTENLTIDQQITESPTIENLTTNTPTTESPIESTMDSYYYDYDISFNDISVNDSLSNTVNPDLLDMDKEYIYSATINEAVSALKQMDTNVGSIQSDSYYEWSIKVKFKLSDNPDNYNSYIYGFQSLIDAVDDSGYIDLNEARDSLNTIYYEYVKDIDTQIITPYAIVYADLGYISVPDSISFQTLFNASTSSNSSDLSYELDSITLLMSANKSEDIDAGSNYSIISSKVMRDKPIPTDSMELLDQDSNSWKISFYAAGIKYSYDVSIPENVYDYSQMSSMDLSQFYTMRMVLSENDTYNNKLILLINNDIDDRSTIDVNDLGYAQPSELEKYIAINLTDMVYIHTAKMIINAVVNKESNYNAYLYSIIPVDIDDLLSIRLSYDYRYNYVLSTGNWKTVDNVYQKDSTFDTAPPRWMWWLSLPVLTIPYEIVDLTNVHSVNQIVKLSSVDDDVSNLFMNELNVSETALDNQDIFKIHLGQFRETWSTGYDIDNVVVMELTYEKSGLVYEVPYEVIDSNVYEPEPEGSTIDKIDEWVEQLPDLMPKETLDSVKVIFTLLAFIFVLSIIKKIINWFK